MKKTITILTTLAILLVSSILSSSEEAKTINWTTNYKEAIKEAQKTNTPLFLYFTGSDWCGWCMRFNKEILDTPQFADTVADKFIFVKLDFPMYKKLPKDIEKQNQKLKEKYHIRGFPTVILLDPELNQIAITGYRNMDNYGEYILELMKDYNTLKNTMANFDATTISPDELQDLHTKATKLSHDEFADTILESGLKHSNHPYFGVEKYRRLIAKSGSTDETNKLREKLLKDAPEEVHYQIAIVDFQNAMHSGNTNPFDTVAPLINYLNKADKNSENTWRIQMTIAQFLANNRENEEAVKYARDAYECAPQEIQPEITTFIEAQKIK